MLLQKLNRLLRTTTRKARSFARRPRFEQAWFVPAWLLLGLSRSLILFCPFRTWASHLGRHTGTAPWIPLTDVRHEAKAHAIARVVAMAANHTPWESNCFPQAVTARVLLGLYGIPYCLFFGVNRNPGDTSMQAHAWVAAGKIRVTGGASFDQFTVVSCFASPGLIGIDKNALLRQNSATEKIRNGSL